MTERYALADIAQTQARLAAEIRSSYWYHIKTRSFYRVVAILHLESSLKPHVVYEHVNTGAKFARPHHEFFDGRFQEVDEIPDATAEGDTIVEE